jgi:hypothetical protein
MNIMSVSSTFGESMIPINYVLPQIIELTEFYSQTKTSLVGALAADHLCVKGAVVRAFGARIHWHLLHAFRVPPLFAKPAYFVAFCSS